MLVAMPCNFTDRGVLDEVPTIFFLTGKLKDSSEMFHLFKNSLVHGTWNIFYTAKIRHLLYKCSYLLCAVYTLAYVWPTFNEEINM